MKMKAEHKSWRYPSAAVFCSGLLTPSLTHSCFLHKPFVESLFESSAQELYFRCVILLSLIAFGVLISRMLAKQREVEERYKNLV
jgi:hypothetical protein